MRITYKVFLVGGIPITIAAAIALAAFLLLNEADRARSGAVLAGTIYRNLLSASASRDDFLDTGRSERTRYYELFLTYAEQARFDLMRLSGVLRDQASVGAAEEAMEALQRYRQNMRQLVDVTVSNDALAAEMGDRADTLVKLTDEARERQHKSNAEIMESLAANDHKLRLEREIVDRGNEFTAAIAAVALLRARPEPPNAAAAAARTGALAFEAGRLNGAAERLTTALDAAGLDEGAKQFGQLFEAYRASASRLADSVEAGEDDAPRAAVTAWVERLLKVHATEMGAVHDQVAELLTYSVQSAETERATQDAAIETLKLSNRTAAAFAARDTAAIAEIHDSSVGLSRAMSTMPISPLIQSEMIDALAEWRQGLATTLEGLKAQTRILTEMDATARRMIDGSRFLNESLTRNAEQIGALVRNILIFGAAVGLLLGSVTGIAVARSITRPLRLLQTRMTELADNARAGPIADFNRRDELGDMARATNVFITEIGRREQALRKSKDRADAALAELRKTQTDLIQAEKLASLGQLVAGVGVAHEINTPLGIALTTATLLGDEANRFAEAAAGGRLQRSVLERFVERMREGTQLLFGNLSRAADLVHSFKQVAADQASGERRPFLMDAWLQDLITSLRPMLRKTRHEVQIECSPGLMVDTYPGALGQVLTNLIANAIAHAYDPDQEGRLSIRVSEPRPDTVRIVFADDGKGIPPENIGKVFDPFFTTGRTTGNTGLGLHIVYNLVTSRLQGHVNLYSRVGRGTRFTIDIPKVVSDASAEAAPEKRRQLEGA